MGHKLLLWQNMGISQNSPNKKGLVFGGDFDRWSLFVHTILKKEKLFELKKYAHTNYIWKRLIYLKTISLDLIPSVDSNETIWGTKHALKPENESPENGKTIRQDNNRSHSIRPLWSIEIWDRSGKKSTEAKQYMKILNVSE